jgi:hypothetical protein
MEHAKADGAGMIDPALDRVLRDFRSSVHAWSEAVYNRPRIMSEAVPRRAAWRKAAAWSLGSLLVAGVAGGGLLEYQHRQEMTRIAAAREAQHELQLASQRAREAEEELARVDSDVARQVPDAMEPLAQLMAEDESQ